MKNQYFGDINDYRKYGLLRFLHGEEAPHLVVSWMLTANDDGNDGRLVGYLRSPSVWRHFDPELFDFLSTHAGDRDDGSGKMSRSGLLNAKFVDTEISDPASRASWLQRSVDLATEKTTLFLDPNTGIEIESLKGSKNRAKSRDYVFYDELLELWERGTSLLIYQHFGRVKRETFCEQTKNRLVDALPDSAVEAIVAGGVGFFLVTQPSHREKLLSRTAMACEKWKGELVAL